MHEKTKKEKRRYQDREDALSPARHPVSQVRKGKNAFREKKTP